MTAGPALEIKLVGGAAEIVGYASLFGGPPDQVRDVVTKGAFVESLARRMPELRREHQNIVGEWKAAREDELGLFVEGRVTDAATIADVRAGHLDGLSIGFIATKAHRSADGVRVLEQVDLPEISLVRRPAKSSARVLSVKSEDPMDIETKDAPADQQSSGDVETRLTKVETAVADIDGRLKKLEGAATTQTKALERIEVKLNRPGVDPKADAKIELKAWDAFLRRGPDGIERKDLTVSTDTAGGYLAPDQFVAELLRNVVQFSPVRAAARVANTSSAAVVLPKRTAGPTASWVGEGPAARPETAPAYGQNRFPVHEAACFVDVSTAMLEDSAFDVASELAFDFAEEFGRIEGSAFVSGSGVLQPVGFLIDAGLAYTPSGHASQITADGLIDLFHALAPAYRGNGVWMMNSTTLAAIRKLKDGTGNYLVLTAGLAGQVTTTLLGRPIVEAPDMPSITGNAYPIVFGDFSQAYRVFDRVQLAVLRDPYSQATNGLTRFHARRRLAAGVAKAEALRKLKIATS